MKNNKKLEAKHSAGHSQTTCNDNADCISGVIDQRRVLLTETI